MQICVLNGSPKGEKSVTMQYVRFLELANPENTFITHHISKKIAAIEKKPDKFGQICMTIQQSDLILWATPVYFQHVPAQYKRFIELLLEKNGGTLFTGKYAASLSTSVHFFDQKVHEYLQGISEDLGMHFAGSFSAAMNDLLEEQNQRQLARFGNDILAACSEKRATLRAYPPVPQAPGRYSPGQISPADTRAKQVLILHDAATGSNLESMVSQMASSFSSVTTCHLDEIGMRGGCLGCVQCAFENKCIYSDEFCSFWRNRVDSADIIVYAGAIRDRYLSATWKQFFDRSFFLGHIPRLKGKQVILMVSGPLAHIPGLRENLSSMLSGGNLVDIITDEPDDSRQIDALISSAATRAIEFSHTGYVKPPTFPEVAGHIVLRDAIWGDLRPIFRADHRYFKANGLYDFPQYQYRKRISRFFFSILLSIPVIQKKVKPIMNDQMIQQFARVFTDSPVLTRHT